jgi:hypothetical protein
MQLKFDGVTYHFRSRGLFVFLDLLKNAHQTWLTFADVVAVLPNITPRQLSRYIDLLQAENLQLVEYKTKTRGRYRLGVSPNLLDLTDLNLHDAAVAKTATPANTFSIADNLPKDLSGFLTNHWLMWLLGLLNGHLQLMDGHLCDQKGALTHLNTAMQATEHLPAWTKSIVYLRLAHTLSRQGKQKEAWQWLRKAETDIRKGIAHPSASMRLQFFRAKIRYDQGDYALSQQIIDGVDHKNNVPSPQLLSMQALLHGQQCFNKAANQAWHLSQALNALTNAIGGVLLWQEDTSLLDALTYNIGNIMLRAIKLGLIDKQYVDTARLWTACNVLVCRKLGLGEDSVLTQLALFDIDFEYGKSHVECPSYLANLQPLLCCGVLGLNTAEEHARQLGNQLELVECLRRKIWINSEAEAKASFVEAMTIADAIKRQDIAKEISQEWQQRFGHLEINKRLQ